jgi:fatty-acyl-CoA synthase
VYRDEELTFTDVDDRSNRLANALIADGVTPQAPVGLLVDNGPHSIPLDFACLKARAVRVPLNSRLSRAEHARMLRETGVRTLVYSPALAERAAMLTMDVDELTATSLGPTDRDDPDLLAAAAMQPPTDPALPTPPDDVVLALYTSGTTGTLKAAQHTQASYAAIVANILANLVSPHRDDAMLHAASLIHASGTFVLPFWLAGARNVVLDGFNPATFLDDVVATGATHVNLVPTMLGMLLADERRAAGDIGRLRCVIYGASPMPTSTLRTAMSLWGPILTQYYGQTEAPLAITVLDAVDHVGGDAPLGSCGQPAVDAEVRVLDDDGNDVARGEVGEIAVRAPFTHIGYLNAPHLDAGARTADGFLRTRDVGRFDEQGYLYLVDRTSDMIITGGYNVYPREVEDALLAHPAIVEAVVVGAPDDTWGEAVTAFVVVRSGAEVTDDELRRVVRDRLAAYKVPKRIERLDAIPKSAVGKLLRRAVRDPLWAGRSRRGATT